eukprot:CAMPEP_0197661582 /NCGR_PEP_ID=MMETSP1338-20131121/51539_1 /TAXON_ID=43686 ORGANISM="Pelagodinium beii, Strain RCC1491" /NCGR_SAMPLE_ID=MMETSP1338 /ASSEMBLY_ACC=CAM_ASM_000754 /LENGTH=375 /DNA_ID=CAMNT_0043239157 /DNA_START=75 /DNA_END=1202 /DNA_ORIENTATION=-
MSAPARCRGGWLAVGTASMAFLAVLHKCSAAGGITDDEKLLFSDGQWHRNQRKSIPLETSCYYTTHAALPYGCQYRAAKEPAYKSDSQRQLEKQALLDMFNALDGPNWRSTDNWDEDLDPCWDYWYGVTCDEHGYVIKLELADNRLVGSLPATIGNLISLLKLDLSSTQPDYHQHENRNINRIEGKMHSLARMTRIEEIEVSGNLITQLPKDLYLNAKTLRSLCASFNKLRKLPEKLDEYKVLHTLELDNNLIADTFPEEFGALSNARIIHLQYNKLKGEINEAIVGMDRVRVFDVAHNPNLGGQLPEEIIVLWAETDYLSILNTSISGYISSLCLDVPFCWKFMYDTHKDLTWATVADVPDIVSMTIELAKSAR